jgi:hypothetical protein
MERSPGEPLAPRTVAQTMSATLAAPNQQRSASQRRHELETEMIAYFPRAALSAALFCIGAGLLIALGNSTASAHGDAEYESDQHPPSRPFIRPGRSSVHALSLAGGGIRVLSADADGLMLSEDRGRVWRRNPIAGKHVETFSVAASEGAAPTYFAGRRDGLWHSTDRGRSWQPVALPIGDTPIPLALAVAPSDARWIYVATARHGVWVSQDGGLSWRAANSGLPEAPGYDGIVEFRSAGVDAADPRRAYLGDDRHGIFRTEDGGLTWQAFNTGLPYFGASRGFAPRFATTPSAPGAVFLVYAQKVHTWLTRNRLFVSEGDARWKPIEVDLPSDTRILTVAVAPDRRRLTLLSADGEWQFPLPQRAGGPR